MNPTMTGAPARRTSPAARDSFERSLWSATAAPAPDCPRLEGRVSTRVAVVGAGYAGLSCAIELARNGCEVTVVEAHEPGFGASGRNGGQVIPLFKYEPEGLVEQYGEDVGRGILDLVAQSARDVFDLVRAFDIPCEAAPVGWIQAAVGEAGAALVARRYRQWHAVGAPVELLDGEAMQRLLGTGQYRVGWRHGGGGTVQPLGYARGLARAAMGLGGCILVDSPVRRLERSGERWMLVGDRGEVVADKLVLATNAYTGGLWPGLRESIVPVYSMQVATEPLGAELDARILPAGQSAADTRHLVRYFRKDAAGRFIIGTRGPFKAQPGPADAAALLAAARAMYPDLRSVDFPYLWAGKVAMTADRVPHLHCLAPGVYTALGWNGRGVAMATTLGRLLARACLDEGVVLPYPVTTLKPIPFHAFHRLGVHAMVTAYRLLDRLS